MVRYKISFIIDGTCFCTEGTSTFPSDEAFISGNYDQRLAMENALIIAGTFKSMHHISGLLDPQSVKFSMELEDEK